MNWTKIPTDLITSRTPDRELIAIIKYQLLWATLERQPDDEIALRYMTQKQLSIAMQYIPSIKQQLCNDIKYVENHRNCQKNYYEKKQTLSNKTDSQSDSQCDSHAERADKIRLDNTPYNPPRDINTASPSSVDASNLNNYPVTPEELAKAEEEVKAFEKMRAERDMFTLGYVRDFSKSEEKPTPKKKKDKSYSYVGQVIKLTDEDYKKWKELYPNIDLFKNLNEIDDWLAKNNADKNWYFRVQKNLQKRNEAANG
jgi:hypothetical protein